MSYVRALGVLRELRDTGPASVRELAAALDTPYGSMWHLVRVLRAEGVIAPAGFGQGLGPTRTAPILWGLAPQHHPKLAPYKRPNKKKRPCSQPAA